MNRLQQELQRLYGLPADGLGRDQAKVRWMVLELTRPAEWAPLGALWGGVQADLALPAPAVAVNGRDGFQLWFSLQEPVEVPQAWAFVDALRRRYLAEVAPAHLALWPARDAGGEAARDVASDDQLNGASDSASDAAPAGAVVLSPQPAWPVPALQADSGLWSAFVSPDLAPLCADEPWLDMPPNPEGQAQLLASLKCISPPDFELALQRLRPTEAPTAPGRPAEGAAAQAPAVLCPKRFLQSVLNNEGLDLALRIEAAKALLPYL
jgi:hypothetical protein